MSIRVRLTLWYTLLLSLTIGLFALVFYLTLERSLRAEIDQTLAVRAAQVRGVVRAALERDGLNAVFSIDLDSPTFDELNTPGIYVELIDVNGTVRARSSNLPPNLFGGATEQGLTEQVLRGATLTTTVRLAGGERVRVYAEPLRMNAEIVGAMRLGESLLPLERTLGGVRALLFAGWLLATAASLVIGLALTRRALAPIARLTADARTIAVTNDYSRRLPEPPYDDELSELAGTFNELIAQVERSLASQQRLLADTSHELRNPLMTVLGNLNLLRRDLPAPLRRESIAEAEGEVERMRRLVADLLLLSRPDAKAAIEHQPVELHKLLHEAYQRAQRMAQGQRVVLERNDPVTVHGDRDRLLQLLLNLIENALRYTPEGGTVSLRLEYDVPPVPRAPRRKRRAAVPAPPPQRARLSVSDTGIGIPPEHLPYLFDRFYRVDAQRARDNGGSGLGLSIVRWVAEAHEGEVNVRSTPGAGTTFEVLLPIKSI